MNQEEKDKEWLKEIEKASGGTLKPLTIENVQANINYGERKEIIGPHKVIKTHDDGDLTVEANGIRYVITTDGQVYRECSPETTEKCEEYALNSINFLDKIQRDWFDYPTDEGFARQFQAKIEVGLNRGYLTEKQVEKLREVPVGKIGIAFTKLLESIVENILSCDCVFKGK